MHNWSREGGVKMGMLDKESALLCFFHFHDLDGDCRCKRCGRIVHRYKTYHE